MGQRKKENHEAYSWKDYKAIARELNRVYGNVDVLSLRRNDLKSLAENILIFDDTEMKPDPYMLDDIRFEWFFLKNGNGENGISGRLRTNF